MDRQGEIRSIARHVVFTVPQEMLGFYSTILEETHIKRGLMHSSVLQPSHNQREPQFLLTLVPGANPDKFYRAFMRTAKRVYLESQTSETA